MSIAYKYRPQHIYEDWLLWEGRWELIDGMPYSTRPYAGHQTINGNLLSLFYEPVKENCKGCKIYMPLSWIINEKNIVQPDMLIINKKIENGNDYLRFTPTLIAEIISSATAFKDRHEKYELYEQEGVKYYLIIDPLFKKIEIYELINNKYQPVSVSPQDYSFSLKDDCQFSVNFDDIWPAS